jgi:WD40 repeat protein
MDGLTIWDVAATKAERKITEKCRDESFQFLASPGGDKHLTWCDAHSDVIAFLPDESKFLWYHHDSSTPECLTLHEATSGNKIRGWSFDYRTSPGGAVAVSPDGRLIAVPQARNAHIVFITLLDAATGKTVAKWEAHDEMIIALAFSPDGCTLVSGERGGAIKVWNLAWIRKELAALKLDW